MTFAPASRSLTRFALTRFGAGVAMLAAAALAGCASTSVFDDLNAAQPTGSAFAQAQFRDYAALARSFGTTEQPSGQSFDAAGSMSLTGTDATTESLAIAFAQKALSAARGEEPLPEAAPDGDAEAEALRLRLLRGLDQGRDKAPEIAARAEADFDCWIMNAKVDTQKGAAAQCHRSLEVSLAQLERAVNLTPVAAPPPPPVATSTTTTTTTATTQTSNYQVYFDFDSWTLTAEDLTAITQAIAAAKAGGQSRIAIVGHTDTSGSVEYNQKLSERRAGVVKDAMVQMGARPEAIQVSGVGKSDLAVPTADGVKEARNRRAVITLSP
jgi:OOP family OmpA-OmpF porin